jgi:hypothetical protein
MRLFLVFIAFLISVIANGQKQVSGKSNKFSFTPNYERGIPPNLFVDLGFEDANGNGILEAEETAELQLTITNKGKGPAQGLVITVSDEFYDSAFQIKDQQEIVMIMPNRSVDINIPMVAGIKVKSAEHRLKIEVKEHFGYDMDPAYLVLNSLKFQSAELSFSGLEIVDFGEGTGAIAQDGQLQAGELVKMKVVVQNIGQNLAESTKYRLFSADENIYIEHGEGELGDLKIGEVKEFWVSISPNKRVTTQSKLPIYLSLTESKELGNLTGYQLPIELNQKPPATALVEVKADIEKIRKQVARFEYTSNKFTANIGKVIDINKVVPTDMERKHSVAIVLGVEKYTNLPPAPYAANDARIVEKYLKERLGVEQVVTYTNDEVQGFAFDDIFNPEYGQLQKAVLKGQTDLFVFYSGHGVPNKVGDKIFLFPSDGKIERLETQGYEINKFYENLEKLGARSTTVFLDACFSGASRSSEKIDMENLVAMKGVSIKPKIYSPWLKEGSNFTVFNSSSASETSLGFDVSQTGLFTYYLCVGLQGKADENGDRKITSGELHDYIQQNVVNTSKKILGVQTPQLNGSKDVVLLEY